MKQWQFPQELKHIEMKGVLGSDGHPIKIISSLKRDSRFADYYAAEINGKKLTIRMWGLSNDVSHDFTDLYRTYSQRVNPYVAQVIYAGIHEKLEWGTSKTKCYMAMEGSFKTLWDCFKQEPFSLKNRFLVILDIASALSILHKTAKIPHENWTPGNILIDERGRAQITDFSIRTFATTVIGTLPFYAPEVLRGMPVGPGSDVYSMAAIFICLMAWGTYEYKISVASLLRNCPFQKLIDLVENCRKESLEERITADGVVTKVNEIIEELRCYAELSLAADGHSIEISFNSEMQRDFFFILLTAAGNEITDDLFSQIQNSFGLEFAKTIERSNSIVRSSAERAPFTIKMPAFRDNEDICLTLYQILTPSMLKIYNQLVLLSNAAVVERDGASYLRIHDPSVFIGKKVPLVLKEPQMDCGYTAKLYEFFILSSSFPSDLIKLIVSYHACKEENFTCLIPTGCQYLFEPTFDRVQREFSWRTLEEKTVLLEDALASEWKNSWLMDNPLKKSDILTRIKEFIFGRLPIELGAESSQLILEYLVETFEAALAWEPKNLLQLTGRPLIDGSRILTAIKESIFDCKSIGLPTPLSQLILSYAQGTFFEPKKDGGQSQGHNNIPGNVGENPKEFKSIQHQRH